MRTSQSLLFFTTYLLYLVSFTSAWPWPVDKIFPDVDSLIVRDAFFKRAETKSSTTAEATLVSSDASAAATASSDSKSASDKSDDSKASETATGSDASGTDTITSKAAKTTATSEKSNSTHTTSTSSISVAANAAAGGLELLIPDTTSGSMFYKISDYVTFAWNYTSLSVTPSYIDVLVSCTSNSQMYTITHNMSVNGNATGAVTWDTNNYPEETSAPLLTAIYTLYIFDADSSINAEASPGHLTVFDYQFGMYTKTPYTPLSAWTCATCSGALSPDERRYLGFMLGMSVITVMSFTWFVGGMGIVW